MENTQNKLKNDLSQFFKEAKRRNTTDQIRGKPIIVLTMEDLGKLILLIRKYLPS